MTTYSATDAALEGFRFTRERPRVLLMWALFLLVANAIGITVMMFAPKEAQEALTTISGQETPDGQQLMSALGVLAPILLLGLLIFRLPFDEVAGIVSGACGNPALLAYASKLIGNDRPDLGYATIFPGMTLVKILFASIVAALA